MEYDRDGFDNEFGNIAAQLEAEDAVARAQDTPEAVESRALGRIATTDPITLEQEITDTRREFARASAELEHATTEMLLRHSTDHLSDADEITRKTQDAMLNDRERVDGARRVVDKLKLSSYEAYRIRMRRRELGKAARRRVFAVPTALLSTFGTLLASAQENIDFSAPSGWLATVGIVGVASAAGRTYQKRYGFIFEATAAQRKAAKMMNLR